MDRSERSGINFVGYEWEYVEEYARELGLRVERVLTAPPRGMGDGPLRVIRQQVRDGVIVCTCAAEDWGETR